jgi:hypothetical protein
MHIEYITPYAAPQIWGAKGGCFPADTSVLTPSGSTPIQDCQIGDKVLCYTPDGEVMSRPITEVETHAKQDLIEFVFGTANLVLTPNHWVLKASGQYDYAFNFEVGDYLVDLKGESQKILYINSIPKQVVYIITVQDYHTFFADGFRVHNKGAGKSGGSPAPAPTEEPNNLFSTDIVFATIALGEGPIYRVNPLGPQDIEINEGTIDDLINLDGDGKENTDVFKTITRTGTLTQVEMPVFGQRTVIPQQLASRVFLRKGNVEGVPKSEVILQNTSIDDYSELIFTFGIQALTRVDEQGNIFNKDLNIQIEVFDRTGTTVLGEKVVREFHNKTNVPFQFQIQYPIPKANRSKAGYKFTIKKISNDSDSSRVQDSISFQTWLEVKDEVSAYPRTALIGYSLLAFNEHVGGVPTFTSVVKGLLVKVPSNYNQPILSTGEVDWRELELPETGVNGYTTNGYRLQSSGTGTLKTDLNPQIYKGVWDGSFTFSWTQNPAWIIYDILTNSTYGLGIPDGNIDIFQFYKVAQYCDGVDAATGKWAGVAGISDGTFRHKPQGKFGTVRETLIGINEGINIKERRFILDLLLADQQQAFDLINQICGTIRAIIIYSGGKLSLQIDMPDEIPIMIFNESNMKPDSVQISGISESEIITGCDVNYVNVANHYKRETIRVDDPTSVDTLNQIENIKNLDLPGVTRRSQAVRYAQYMIAASKFVRRKIGFETDTSALSLVPGDLIAVQQRLAGTAWGFGGRVRANSALRGSSNTHTVQTSNVFLEHFTAPAITSAVFTANTFPVGMRIFNNRNDDMRLYIVSNNHYDITSTGTKADGTSNVSGGSDSVTVKALEYYDLKTRTWNVNFAWTANTVPARGDMWNLGEVNPDNFYRDTTDKLFKISDVQRDEDEKVTVTAAEYIANVYIDSDTAINYTPVRYVDTYSPLVAPPAPQFILTPNPRQLPDGGVVTDIDISDSTDVTNYPIAIKTIYEYAVPSAVSDILTVNP